MPRGNEIPTRKRGGKRKREDSEQKGNEEEEGMPIRKAARLQHTKAASYKGKKLKKEKQDKKEKKMKKTAGQWGPLFELSSEESVEENKDTNPKQMIDNKLDRGMTSEWTWRCVKELVKKIDHPRVVAIRKRLEKSPERGESDAISDYQTLLDILCAGEITWDLARTPLDSPPLPPLPSDLSALPPPSLSVRRLLSVYYRRLLIVFN